MYGKKLLIAGTLSAVALVIACSKVPGSPAAPTATPGSGEAAADGSTWKVTAPTAKSPIGGAQPQGAVVLVVGPSSGKHATVTVTTYRFQVFNSANAMVCNGTVAVGAGDVSFTPSTCTFNFDEIYTWKARGEQGALIGPWSATASFKAPAGGYLRGTEIYDPLTNGKTVGTVTRGVTFLPGVGVRLDANTSYVEYRLETPLTDGEMSAEMTNIGNGSEEYKTKVLSMLQGDGVNITDNPFRLTLDKRTTWENQGSRIRYTLRSRGIDSGEPRGGDQSWSRTQIYFWKYEWRGGVSRLRVYEGSRNGRLMEDLNVGYASPYNPNPHLVRLGSVDGRAGSDSNPGTIIRNLWVSSQPRPILPGEAK